jgi:flagellin
MDELGNEIDRIANNTDYNGIKPLAEDSNKGADGKNNGTKLNMTMQIGPTKGEVLDLKGQDMTLKGIFKDLDKIDTANVAANGKSVTGGSTAIKDLIAAKKLDATQAQKDLANAIKDAAGREGLKVNGSISVTVNASTGAVTIDGAGYSSTIATNSKVQAALKDAYDSLDGVQKSKEDSATTHTDGKEYIQITSASGEDVTANANRVVKNIQSAIDHVSSYRAELGAKQNRLEHTINNLQVTSENTTAAESRIRDTDMAKEMAAYTKNNILSQAAQSMLAQANQSGQGVLSLLQ